MQMQNKLSSNYLTSSRLNNVTLEVLEVNSLSLHLERSDYCLERSDYLVERSDQRMERSGLERSDRNSDKHKRDLLCIFPGSDEGIHRQ